VVGRRRWRSFKLQIPAQPFDVHHEVEPKYAERTSFIDAIASGQPPDRLEPPQANEPIVDNEATPQETAPVEETGESEKEDPIATSPRKKPLRRRRGKKKKGPNLTVPVDDDEPEGDFETDVAPDTAEEGSGKIQLILPTPVSATTPSVPALRVSEKILGMSWFMRSNPVPDR